ncbi:MAG: FeoA domain-containing protein [Pseudomonadota bacterium]
MVISELTNGERFKVIKVTLAREIGKRLADMGFNEGVEGKVVRCALLGDPIQVHILDYDISIRRSEAAGVEIRKIIPNLLHNVKIDPL